MKMKTNRIFITFLSSTKIDRHSSGGIITLIQDTIDYLIDKKEEVIFITNNLPLKRIKKNIKYQKCFSFINQLIKSTYSNKNFNNKLIVFGCARPWGYLVIIICILFGFKVFWHPSYHPSKFVENKLNAKLAKFLIYFLSNLNIKNLIIICQTKFESKVLGLNKNNIKYGIMTNFFKGTESFNKQTYSFESFKKRKYKITFIGRATKQKGWDKFLKMVSNLEKNELACAIISKKYNPEIVKAIKKHKNLLIFNEISKNKLLKILQETTIFYLPSNYESLGISQIEAVIQGCFVPLIGRYPFWDSFNLNPNEEINILNKIIKNKNYLPIAHKNIISKISFLEEKKLEKIFENTIKEIIKS